jgi:hypothetical protein
MESGKHMEDILTAVVSSENEVPHFLQRIRGRADRNLLPRSILVRTMLYDPYVFTQADKGGDSSQEAIVTVVRNLAGDGADDLLSKSYVCLK